MSPKTKCFFGQRAKQTFPRVRCEAAARRIGDLAAVEPHRFWVLWVGGERHALLVAQEGHELRLAHGLALGDVLHCASPLTSAECEVKLDFLASWALVCPSLCVGFGLPGLWVA